MPVPGAGCRVPVPGAGAGCRCRAPGVYYIAKLAFEDVDWEGRVAPQISEEVLEII